MYKIVSRIELDDVLDAVAGKKVATVVIQEPGEAPLTEQLNVFGLICKNPHGGRNHYEVTGMLHTKAPVAFKADIYMVRRHDGGFGTIELYNLLTSGSPVQRWMDPVFD